MTVIDNYVIVVPLTNMDGEELRKLVPKAKSFFTVGENPGMIMSNNQAWVFEDGEPRPITQTEIIQRGGVEDTDNEIAELIGLQPNAVKFLTNLKKNPIADLKNSIARMNPATIKAGGQTTAA